MTDMEKYIKVFMDLFGKKEDEVKDLHYQDILEWDSVGHMTLIAQLENVFDIRMDTDDIIDFESFLKGMEILKKYGVKFDD